MGYRTVVILNNDQAGVWERDPELGRKIAIAMNYASGDGADLGYGRVVECTHTSVQTLAEIDGLDMTSLSHSQWNPNQIRGDVTLQLLRQAAAKLGYNLTKQRGTS